MRLRVGNLRSGVERGPLLVILLVGGRAGRKSAGGGQGGRKSMSAFLCLWRTAVSPLYDCGPGCPRIGVTPGVPPVFPTVRVLGGETWEMGPAVHNRGASFRIGRKGKLILVNTWRLTSQPCWIRLKSVTGFRVKHAKTSGSCGRSSRKFGPSERAGGHRLDLTTDV